MHYRNGRRHCNHGVRATAWCWQCDMLREQVLAREQMAARQQPPILTEIQEALIADLTADLGQELDNILREGQ